MKCVFVSNYFNHHQASLANELKKLCEGQFWFISTIDVPEGRKKLGYASDCFPDYVVLSHKSKSLKKYSLNLINSADVVIVGSAPESYIKKRLSSNKLTFRCQERLYKEDIDKKRLPLLYLKHYLKHIRYKNLYLLCASAFTSADYSKTYAFEDKAYKWAYFTEIKKYDNIDNIISDKQPHSILWVGRLIKFKHPELVVELAHRLKEEGYDFSVNIIGVGEMYDDIEKLIKDYGLTDCIHMLGSMPPEQVRTYMEKSEIFLFTSGKEEGWGAVLNESMNSACAVIASHAIGSVPYLLNNGQNGFVYRDGDIDDIYCKVKTLLDTPQKRKELAKKAYYTMRNEWNAENAAKKFYSLVNIMLEESENKFPYKDGVCSKAEITSDDWFISKQ